MKQLKISAKEAYAYKAVLQLAIQYEFERPVRLGELSQAQGIPKKFLVQILLRLIDAQIVRSKRGTLGGYYLARNPGSISLLDVLQAVDSHMLKSYTEVKKSRMRDSEKLIFQIWSKVGDDIKKSFSVRFDELVARLPHNEIVYQI